MFVLKRDGRKEPVMFDKITARVRKMCYGLNKLVDPVKVAMRVIEGLYDGVTTSELDNLAAETAATMTVQHPDYARLAARIAVSNLHKNTKKTFSDVMTDLYNYVNPRTGKKAPLLSDETYKVIMDNAAKLDSTIIYNRDFGYDYFGFKTLERSYLLKLNGKHLYACFSWLSSIHCLLPDKGSILAESGPVLKTSRLIMLYLTRELIYTFVLSHDILENVEPKNNLALLQRNI